MEVQQLDSNESDTTHHEIVGSAKGWGGWLQSTTWRVSGQSMPYGIHGESSGLREDGKGVMEVSAAEAA